MPPPVDTGRITAVFGPTDEPLDSGGVNKGLDIGVPVGTPFRFTVDGVVVHAGPGKDGWGISVKVRDASGLIHNYGHLSVAGVKVGDTVKAGQQGGLTGNTGASTGPHLSYDVLAHDGRAVDPSPFLGFNAIGDNRTSQMIGVNIAEVGAPRMEDVQYWEKRREYNALMAQYGLWLESPDLAMQLGIPKPPPAIVQQMLELDGFLADYEEQYVPGASPGEITSAYNLWNSTDPALIDAQNMSEKYAREYSSRVDAAAFAQDGLAQQLSHVADATSQQQGMIDSAAGGAPRAAGALALPARMKSGEELFKESLDRITKGLPDVPGMPYPARPPSLEGIIGGNGAIPGYGTQPPVATPKSDIFSNTTSQSAFKSELGYDVGIDRSNMATGAPGGPALTNVAKPAAAMPSPPWQSARGSDPASRISGSLLERMGSAATKPFSWAFGR